MLEEKIVSRYESSAGAEPRVSRLRLSPRLKTLHQTPQAFPMLVDNPLHQQFFSSGPSYDAPSDLSEFFDTELFSSVNNNVGSSSSSSSSSSPQSPYQPILTTPPQPASLSSFPEIQDWSQNSSFNSSSLFNFLDDDINMKLSDPLSLAPYSFFGSGGGGGGAAPVTAIDPQLVGTPSTAVDDEEQQGQEEQEEKEKEKKITLTINPVKVGGHGKARKGTVQNGGVTKKVAAAPALQAPPTTSLLFSSSNSNPNKDKENHSRAMSVSKDDDDDELPEDWRPSPEVFQKMTSKEKRQLRNKISARNFRVRRKEYISTLELDIAERDRLLQAIRTELGSSQSENVALRQEIAALKKALLEGRTGQLTQDDIPIFNLPPPAPLSSISASSSSSSSSSSALLTANTQKDVPSNSMSPRLGAFWGGANVGIGLGGGITPVHTVLVPELSALARNVNRGGLQENINPTLNSSPTFANLRPAFDSGKPGFDGFADMNPFTMKSLDAYRMQLWTKMASQQQQQNHYYSNNSSPTSSQGRSPTPPPLISSPSPFTNSALPSTPPNAYSYPSPSHSPLHGLASSIKPHFFASSSKANVPSQGSTLSALLAGKHNPSSNSLTPSLARKEQATKERDQAVFAALASQTLLKRLGGAFWDAFSGTAPAAPGASAMVKQFDADKVRRVLEGKAVVRIVDVEPTKPTSPRLTAREKECSCTAVLEESLRSLTLGRK
ncbi:hypothetical protein C8J56DRAFT_165315 [Mycena floridula]|nr:hypothetical protein C8J56DRAFT_165315 [Mycena floridula]